jgi:H+/gluconate symporter-like permease
MDNAPDQTAETTTPPAPAPVAAPLPVAPEPKKGPAYGAILGIILIVVVLVVGAFYVWGERLKTSTQPSPENAVPSEGTMPTGSADASVDVSAPQAI